MIARAVDEGLATDADSDGHGDPLSCDTDSSLPVNDCDDNAASTFPFAETVICNEKDEDCDGLVDDDGGD